MRQVCSLCERVVLKARLRHGRTHPLGRERPSAQGMDALGGTAAVFSAFIADDIAKWTKVVTSAGLYE